MADPVIKKIRVDGIETTTAVWQGEGKSILKFC
jgi:hypothetical protein